MGQEGDQAGGAVLARVNLFLVEQLRDLGRLGLLRLRAGELDQVLEFSRAVVGLKVGDVLLATGEEDDGREAGHAQLLRQLLVGVAVVLGDLF